MSKDRNNKQIDTETISITLDQIDQTIEIMTNAVGRLRGYLNEHEQRERDVEQQVSDSPQVPTPPISTNIH